MTAYNFKLKIHPKICSSIAKEYVDNIYRVFLEYVDNALDSAEEYFDKNKNEYKKKICITVTFDGKNIDVFRVFIDDNTRGIDNPENIFTNIGNSSKASSSILNGQFGYGINSFLAVCNKLSVASKTTDNAQSKKVTVTKNNYDNPDEDIEVEETSGFGFTFGLGNSWTRFTLEEFFVDKYKGLNEMALKVEIEKHFESILRRINLEVKIVTREKNSLLCKPFDYSKYVKNSFVVDIDKVFYTSSKKYKKKAIIDISKNPIQLRIYISTEKSLNRKPFLIVNGRRIQDVSDISGYRTYSKSQIWSHPNVTGYIDTKGHLIPKMGRSDVLYDSKLAKAIFNTLLSYEADIKRAVYDALKVNINGKFKKLESILSKVTSNLINNKINNLFKGTEKSLVGIFQSSPFSRDNYIVYEREVSETKTKLIPKSGKSIKPNRPKKDSISEEIGFNVNPGDFETTQTGKLNNPSQSKNDLSITLDNDSKPPCDKDNKPLRSAYYDGVIVIYSKHEEYQKRQTNSRDATPKITSSMISYICHEILCQIFNLIDNKRESYFDILKLFIDSFNDLEDSLKEYVDRDLNELI